MFDLLNKVVVITGGAGLLGIQHARALAEYGATTVLLDINEQGVVQAARDIDEAFDAPCVGLAVDITDEGQVEACAKRVLDMFGHIDSLINNAANNPKVEDGLGGASSRLENFSLAQWNQDLAVGLTGAFLCAKHFGAIIAEGKNGGTIINISSDLGVIAPDQRLYSAEGVADAEQEVKPVTYSVTKSGIIGLTRYMATYWAERNVRSNALCFGGVETNQPEAFLNRVRDRIPMGRMARPDEYSGTIVFMVSDDAEYMNGSIISMDGGRSAW